MSSELDITPFTNAVRADLEIMAALDGLNSDPSANLHRLLRSRIRLILSGMEIVAKHHHAPAPES